MLVKTYRQTHIYIFLTLLFDFFKLITHSLFFLQGGSQKQLEIKFLISNDYFGPD